VVGLDGPVEVMSLGVTAPLSSSAASVMRTSIRGHPFRRRAESDRE
jgi:hypothetical protein